MRRDATLSVSLTPEQLRLVRQRVECGHYGSASEVIRDGLRILFQQDRPSRRLSSRTLQRRLSAGYKATAARDRELTREWAQLPDAWPEK